jgi:RHS repeat-associated protein
MGGQYEVKDGTTKKYYSIAGMLVAVDDGSAVQYLLTDHLGSTVAVTNSSGTLTSQQRYLPFGGTRAIPNSPILATDFGYTGQRLLDSGMGGIMDYKARFYSVYLNRFLQPDTIIPNSANPQSWNRFSYVTNNPLRYTDPSGHMMIGDDDLDSNKGSLDCRKYSQYCNNGKIKSSAELRAMRVPKKPEPPKPWELNKNFSFGYHIGGASNAPMPDYYGETENSANIPYFPGGNQNPNVCVGGAGGIGCLISLGASLIPYNYGPTNTDSNFFVSFNVNYNESVGITMSNLYWANQYSGQAVLGQVTINDKVLLQETSYMPTYGTYRPVLGSGGVYNSNNQISIEMAILTVINTPNGAGGVWQYPPPIVLPSLPELMDALR